MNSRVVMPPKMTRCPNCGCLCYADTVETCIYCHKKCCGACAVKHGTFYIEQSTYSWTCKACRSDLQTLEYFDKKYY